jgi:hypothetical protein
VEAYVKVNFGCGDRYASGWVNVDHQGMPHRKDVTLDVRNPLPWDKEIHYAYVGHLLEHLFVDEVIVFLQRLRAAMQPGGFLMVVGPDVIRAQGLLDSGVTLEVPFNELRLGADRWLGDTHHWDCTSWAVYRLLQVTGWVDVVDVGIERVPDLWPVAVRGPRWQCAVGARPGEGPFHDFI